MSHKNRLMRSILYICLWITYPTNVQAQNPQSEGARLIFHPTIDIKGNWYATLWAIANVRNEIPNNINLFTGAGLRFEQGYFEAMLWQQWTTANKTYALDFRLQKKGVYLEISPLLSKRGLYDFLIIEQPLTKRISVGGETENIHLLNKDDSWGGGPRASVILHKNQHFKLMLVGSYQFRNDHNTARAYVVAHFRIPREK